MKHQIELLLQAAIATLPPEILPADVVLPPIEVDRTRDAAHGDFATTSMVEVWLDDAERRTWFLYEAARKVK